MSSPSKTSDASVTSLKLVKKMKQGLTGPICVALFAGSLREKLPNFGIFPVYRFKVLIDSY